MNLEQVWFWEKQWIDKICFRFESIANCKVVGY